MNIRKGVDLGASFERLLEMERKSWEGDKTPENYAYNLGLLQGAIKLHIAECTTDEPETNCENPDDIPLGLFQRGE